MQFNTTRNDERSPTAEDFTNVAVMRKVMSHAVQHPLTIFPLVISVACGLAAVLFGSLTAFAGALGLLAVAGGSWAYNYFLKGEELSRDYVKRLRINWERNRSEKISALEERCRNEGFSEGEKEASELRNAYEKLRIFLEEKSHGGDNLSAQRYLVLATESFERGAHFLEQALVTHKAVDDINEHRLEIEIKRLKKKFSVVLSEAEQRAVQSQIDSQQKRIDLRKERASEIAQLLARCENEESALEVSYLELVQLFQASGDALFGNSKKIPASELERAVAATRKVEERLRGLTDTSAEDEMYDKQR